MQLNGVPKSTRLLLLAFMGVTASIAAHAAPSKPWGKTAEGQPVRLYTVTNHHMSATITNYGGIVTSLNVPDKAGKTTDVVLGYPTLAGYLKNEGNPYFGALIGRYGNRIAKGTFSLVGQSYKLATNDHVNHLHGGKKGYDKVVWDVLPSKDTNKLTLRYVSKDGEEGYPGKLVSTVTYTITDDNGLRVDYSAVTDKPTVVNLTHHSYFNLDGAGNGDILGTRLQINASKYTPIDAGAIPTGVLDDVEKTPFDFRTSTAIGKRVNDKDEQLINGKGYDHNFVLDGAGLRRAATAVGSKSGRVMDVWTTEPGLQFYCGNYLSGQVGKGGKPYKYRYGFCLEAQHYPDSPNEPAFPSTELKPGETYKQTTIYKFH